MNKGPSIPCLLFFSSAAGTGRSGLVFFGCDTCFGFFHKWNNNKAIPAGTNNSTNIHYHFADPAFLDDISYYQVKQTNLDGKVFYSDPIFVDKLVNRASLFIYPNPSSGNNIKVAFAWEGKKEIQLNDLSGRRIQQWSAFSGPRLEISGLLPGSYVLTVMDNESRDRDSKLMVVSR